MGRRGCNWAAAALFFLFAATTSRGGPAYVASGDSLSVERMAREMPAIDNERSFSALPRSAGGPLLRHEISARREIHHSRILPPWAAAAKLLGLRGGGSRNHVEDGEERQQQQEEEPAAAEDRGREQEDEEEGEDENNRAGMKGSTTAKNTDTHTLRGIDTYEAISRHSPLVSQSAQSVYSAKSAPSVSEDVMIEPSPAHEEMLLSESNSDPPSDAVLQGSHEPQMGGGNQTVTRDAQPALRDRDADRSTSKKHEIMAETSKLDGNKELEAKREPPEDPLKRTNAYTKRDGDRVAKIEREEDEDRDRKRSSGRGREGVVDERLERARGGDGEKEGDANRHLKNDDIRERGKERGRDGERNRERERNWERDRERKTEEREGARDRASARDWERGRNREGDRDWKGGRDGERRRRRGEDIDRNKDRSRERDGKRGSGRDEAAGRDRDRSDHSGRGAHGEKSRRRDRSAGPRNHKGKADVGRRREDRRDRRYSRSREQTRSTRRRVTDRHGRRDRDRDRSRGRDWSRNVARRKSEGRRGEEARGGHPSPSHSYTYSYSYTYTDTAECEDVEGRKGNERRGKDAGRISEKRGGRQRERSQRRKRSRLSRRNASGKKSFPSSLNQRQEVNMTELMKLDPSIKKKIHVQGFGPKTREIDLQMAFDPIGNVVEVFLARKTLFAFITFETAEQALAAVEQRYGHAMPDGSRITVQIAKPRIQSKNNPSNELFLGSLPDTIEERDIVEMMTPHGDLTGVLLRKAPLPGRTGYAFARFQTKKDATKALRYWEYKPWKGALLRIDYAVEGRRRKYPSHWAYRENTGAIISY